MSRTDAAESKSMLTSIRDVTSQPQFQISFLSTVAGSVVSMGLQWMTWSAMALYERSTHYKPDDLRAADQYYAEGVYFLEKVQRYPEALQSFTQAKIHFEKTLFAFSKTNPRLHQLYCNVCYNQAFAHVYCGDLDKARTVLLQAEQQLQVWGADYHEYDFHNLRGIIYLKEKKHSLAKDEFEKSLVLNPNQKEIIYLRKFIMTMETCGSEGKPTDQDGLAYLTDTKLFDPSNVRPLAFEVNMAIILSLKHTHLKESFLRLQELEDFYMRINASYCDRMRIYEMAVDILGRLKIAKIALVPIKAGTDEKEPSQPQKSVPLDPSAEVDKLIEAYNAKIKVEKEVDAFCKAKQQDHKADAKSSAPSKTTTDEKRTEKPSKPQGGDLRWFKIGSAAVFVGGVAATVIKTCGR